MKIRETKKRIKNLPAGRLWSEHIRFWLLDSVNLRNDYRDLSRKLADFDISELAKLVGVSKKDLKKYFIWTL